MMQEVYYSELTQVILGCYFDVMDELGSGFLESIYKNALSIAIKDKGIHPDHPGARDHAHPISFSSVVPEF